MTKVNLISTLLVWTAYIRGPSHQIIAHHLPPPDTKRWSNAGVMLGQCLQRWPNVTLSATCHPITHPTKLHS